MDIAAAAPPLVDLWFPVQGRTLPRDHRELLTRALTARLPWLAAEPGSGVHRMNVAAGGAGDAPALLSGRTRLTLRLPRRRAGLAAATLAGQTLAVGRDPLRLGNPQQRELLPHRTLYAHFVVAPADDEAAFLAMVEDELHGLGVSCRPVCGRRLDVAADGALLPGFSLMLDGLGRDDALRVLLAGLGPRRPMGCGLFVAHKSAAAVGE